MLSTGVIQHIKHQVRFSELRLINIFESIKMAVNQKKDLFRYVPTLERLRADLGLMYQQIETGDNTSSNTSQMGEVALLSGLIQTLISQDFDPEEEQMLAARVSTILDAVRTKNLVLDAERKYAERIEKLRILKMRHQGFTLEEFTQSVAMIFKISSKYIPEDRLMDFSSEIDSILKEKASASQPNK
jgi:hypothetical protein